MKAKRSPQETKINSMTTWAVIHLFQIYQTIRIALIALLVCAIVLLAQLFGG